MRAALAEIAIVLLDGRPVPVAIGRLAAAVAIGLIACAAACGFMLLEPLP